MSEVNHRVLVIPNYQDWEYQALEQLCVHVGRGTAPCYVEQSDVKAIGQRCVSKTGFDPSYARPHSERAMAGTLQAIDGDVLLNSTGTGTIGRSVVFRESGSFIVDGHVTALRPKEGKFSSVWLSAVLQSPWGQEHLERFCYAGSTNQVELSASALRVTEVPTPPYNEQSKIAEILDTLDAAIRGTEAVVAKLKAMKQGLLHDLLTRGIDANGDLRPPQPEAPHLYKQTLLGWLPKEWDVAELGAITRELTQGWSPDCPSEPALAHEWGVLKTTAVVWSGYQEHENKRLPERMKPRPLLQAEVDDILITRAGPSSRVAVVAHVPATRDKLMISDKLYRLRVTGTQNPAFIAAALSSVAVQREISKTISGMAESQTNISQATLKPLPVPVPPKWEQDAIMVGIMSQSQKLKDEEALLYKLRLQKTGLMDDLLTGRTPVTALL